uniref:HIG1 domain-containing protein n=1 Tax=Caenorhabditis japonica TaxID=281687 RepID=A0A8R1DLK2_CAEJA
MNAEPHDFRDHKAHMQWTQERDAIRANVPLIPQDMSGGSRGQSASSTVLQKALNNPLVPIGMLTTVGCLVGMMVSTLRRSSRDAQYFMRGRVVAQGLTIAAMVGGAVMFGIGAPSDAALRAPGKGQANFVSLTPPVATPNSH